MSLEDDLDEEIQQMTIRNENLEVSNVQLENEILALKAKLLSAHAEITAKDKALAVVADAFEYGSVGGTNERRLMALIREARMTSQFGDTWEYWKYLEEKIELAHKATNAARAKEEV